MQTTTTIYYDAEHSDTERFVASNRKIPIPKQGALYRLNSKVRCSGRTYKEDGATLRNSSTIYNNDYSFPIGATLLLLSDVPCWRGNLFGLDFLDGTTKVFVSFQSFSNWFIEVQ